MFGHVPFQERLQLICSGSTFHEPLDVLIESWLKLLASFRTIEVGFVLRGNVILFCLILFLPTFIGTPSSKLQSGVGNHDGSV